MKLLYNACIQLTLLTALAGAAQPTAGVSVSGPPSAAPAPVLPVAPTDATGAAPVAPMVLATQYLSAPTVAGRQSDLAQAQLRMLIDAEHAGCAAEGVLLVPDRQTEAKSFDPLVEDLTIMSRIIERSLGDGYLLPEVSAMDSLIINLTLPSANVGPRLFFPLSKRPKPMYVGGYGAVFFLQVDFPLVAPVEPSEETDTQESDPVWSDARRALYEPPNAALGVNPAPAEPYDEDKVAMLRSRLTDILRHATNIRTPDPNDWVAIVVRGAPTGDASPAINAGPGLPVEVPCGRTVLTLRARKADIDLYAKGQLDPAQIEQRIQVANSKQ